MVSAGVLVLAPVAEDISDDGVEGFLALLPELGLHNILRSKHASGIAISNSSKLVIGVLHRLSYGTKEHAFARFE